MLAFVLWPNKNEPLSTTVKRNKYSLADTIETRDNTLKLLTYAIAGSGDKSKPILGQKQAINFRTILDPTLLKKIEKNYRHTHTQMKSSTTSISMMGYSHITVIF